VGPNAPTIRLQITPPFYIGALLVSGSFIVALFGLPAARQARSPLLPSSPPPYHV